MQCYNIASRLLQHCFMTALPLIWHSKYQSYKDTKQYWTLKHHHISHNAMTVLKQCCGNLGAMLEHCIKIATTLFYDVALPLIYDNFLDNVFASISTLNKQYCLFTGYKLVHRFLLPVDTLRRDCLELLFPAEATQF